MTGFAQGRFNFANRSLGISLKSLNYRYLDITFRGNAITPAVEKKFKNLFKDRLFRGKVEIVVEITENDPDCWNVQLNENLLSKIMERLIEFKKKYKKDIVLSLDSLLRLPSVFHIQGNFENDLNAKHSPLQDAITTVINDFIASRQEEGSFILNDLIPSINQIDVLVEQIRESEKESERQILETYRKRIEKLLEGIDVDEKRIIQEAAVYAEKISIHEETNRLATHNQRLKNLLHDQRIQTKGREADFLVQEMLRETHTMVAKSESLTIHECLLLIRRELEKIKQQVQNIE